MPRITPTVSDMAKQIYESIETVRQRGHFVDMAIIEKWERDNGKLFTDAEKEEIRKIVQEEIRRYNNVSIP
jgi:hypothetical protein